MLLTVSVLELTDFELYQTQNLIQKKKKHVDDLVLLQTRIGIMFKQIWGQLKDSFSREYVVP
jgi:hypothetical protein